MTTWEAGHRQPCLMHLPGEVPAGMVGSEPVMTIDLLPTLAQLAGAALGLFDSFVASCKQLLYRRPVGDLPRPAC
jgi:arylsulfatase A-like enzyme